jgi:DNA-directed RNA polymerase specialized sigma24 family protein
MNESRTGLKTNEDILIEHVRKKLYPEDIFPETLFPDLNIILVDLYRTLIQSNHKLLKTVQETGINKIVEQKAEEISSLEYLLKNHPQIIVKIYHYLIKKYVQVKHLIPDDREDIFQEIITRLLSNKMFKIQKHFKFNLKKRPSFTSYLMVIVRNIYVDIFRENKMRIMKTVDHQEFQPYENDSGFFSPSNHLFVEEEYTKLHTILKMYHHSRFRIELVLKIKNRIPVTTKDIKKCFPDCSLQNIRILSQDFRFKIDRDVFEIIVPVFNQYEQKKNKSDTLRKWISVKIDEIISHLNHTHNHSVYNNENINDLFCLYYQKNQFSGEKGNGIPPQKSIP